MTQAHPALPLGSDPALLDDLRWPHMATFLAGTPWASARIVPLAADASFRRYFRLFDMQAGAQAVLMDAPPAHEPKTPQFVMVAEELRALGLSAPAIEKADLAAGFVLLEDFGDASFTAKLSRAPGDAGPLYQAACAVIQALDGHVLAPLPPYDQATLETELSLFTQWWWPDARGADLPAEAQAAFTQAWAAPLAKADRAAKAYPALTLRDFHVDNLFDLPARTGLAQIGLLDFQDALTGHSAYDLVSLLQDVRQDVDPDVQQRCLDTAVKHAKDPEFMDIYAILGAQRAMKILGIFIRLDVRDGKPGYRRYLPAAWARLTQNLDNPNLSGVAQWLQAYMPDEMGAGRA